MATEAYLQVVQSIVSRLAAQSTTIKGWSVTVTAGLLGFGATSTAPMVSAIAIYVILAFAVLDAYYLALERTYRDLYQGVVTDQASPWHLGITPPGPRQIGAAICSPVILILYGSSLLVASALGAYYLLTK